ncbi:hypothetical protein PCOAH_00012770 [Plasmodium coatneyi]|uniref:SICA antigen n=1 Tax=Plasmodium coatneyi TaxID=208452 RepID=A0A1B1DWK9_9APIC|nr:hypothetical protein PCOAH_00012770 [Plasmodium coatneyi]ANQ07148.1 hypothetical protein PCOAH_00012770 [Plasmodium coatneyi]
MVDKKSDKVEKKVETFFQTRWSATKDQVYGLFLDFNKPLSADDEKDVFTVVCDEVVDGYDVTNQTLRKCFCKILMRNLRKVTSKDSEYAYNEQTWTVDAMGQLVACDLLNLWLLLYVLKSRINKENIKYVFTAITSLNEAFSFMESEDCIYKSTFSVNETEEGASFKDIYTWFRNRGIIEKMGEIHSGNACRSGSRSDDQDSGLPETNVEDIRSKVQDIADKVLKKIEELQEIVNEIEPEEAPPTPGSEPSGTAEESEGEEEEGEHEDVSTSDEKEETVKEKPQEEEEEPEQKPRSDAPEQDPGPIPAPAPVPAQLRQRINQPNLTSYLPLAPAVLGISIMSYLLWKCIGFRILGTLECFVRQENVTEDLIKYVVHPYRNKLWIIWTNLVHLNIP